MKIVKVFFQFLVMKLNAYTVEATFGSSAFTYISLQV